MADPAFPLVLFVYVSHAQKAQLFEELARAQATVEGRRVPLSELVRTLLAEALATRAISR